MDFIYFQKSLNCPLLHPLSPPLLVIDKRTAVNVCQNCCFVYRHTRTQTVVPELHIQWELLNLGDALPCQLGVQGILILYKPLGYAEFQCSTRSNKCFLSVTIANQIKMYFRKIKHQLTEVSISDPIDSDAEGNALTLADICSSDINVEEDVILKINSEKLYRFIEEELDEREREIIAKRYGIPDRNGRICKPLAQREIAKELGISRSYISRIEKRALEKLRGRFG